MKKILILTRKEPRPDFDQKATYEAGLSKLETMCEYTVEEFENLVFFYDGTELKVVMEDGVTDISSFDVVFLVGWFKTKMLEDMALSVSLYLQGKKVKTINSEALYTRSRTKLSQYVHAVLNDVSVIPFLFSMNPALLQRSMKRCWSFGYPVIVKGVLASRGDENYLVKGWEDASAIIERASSEEGPWFVVQSFIPNDGDYRIIAMGDQVVTVIHRRSQSDSHLNNTSKGAEASIVDPNNLPHSLISASVRLATVLRREVAGVDMVQHKDTGEFFLLEINNMPQMATGSYITDKLRSLDTYLAGQ